MGCIFVFVLLQVGIVCTQLLLLTILICSMVPGSQCGCDYALDATVRTLAAMFVILTPFAV